MNVWGFVTKGNKKVTCRLDSKGCFAEVRTDALYTIGKITVAFVRYDTTKPIGQRQVEKVKVYLNPEDARALSNMLTAPGTNGIFQMAKQARAAAATKGKKFPEDIWRSSTGGTRLDDGSVICRQLSIYPGTQHPYEIVGTSGKGKVTKSGYILFDGTPTVNIRIPVDDFGLFKFAAGLEAAFIGYCSDTFVEKPVEDEQDYSRELSREELDKIEAEEWEELFKFPPELDEINGF